VTDIAIASSRLAATLSPLGAELTSLTGPDGQALLWHGDGSWWRGRAPILFPIVGALSQNRHPVGGQFYDLPRHGFARTSTFEVAEQSADAVTFRLEDSPATRKSYPYAFQLDLSFSLDGDTLTTTATVTNTGDVDLPFSFGYHPAFLWPLPGAGGREAQVVEFEVEETEPASRIDQSGLLVGPEPVNRIVGRQLKLTDDLFDDDALLYLAPKSRKLRFGAADGSGTSLEVAFPDMPHLGIWTKPGGAPYLCIEPWQGYASPVGFAGPLTEKPGTIILAPGSSHSMTMAVTLRI
jgi:galactose mutarotase-like enzyme